MTFARVAPNLGPARVQLPSEAARDVARRAAHRFLPLIGWFFRPAVQGESFLLTSSLRGLHLLKQPTPPFHRAVDLGHRSCGFTNYQVQLLWGALSFVRGPTLDLSALIARFQAQAGQTGRLGAARHLVLLADNNHSVANT